MPARKFHVRQAAVSALHAWASGDGYAEDLVERQSSRRHLSPADRALLQSILFSVLRNRRLLDHWISKLREGKLDPETRDVLRVGLCQILLLGIAEHAAVNETVESAKSAVRGLINAVLRRAIVSRKQLLSELGELPPAVALSHPDWLWNRWRKAFGAADAVRLMEWNNEAAEVFVRINPLAPASAEIPGTPVKDAPGFFKIDKGIPSALLASGAVYAQDPATRHSVELLDPKPDERILDACAAPGGKAFLIAAACGSAKNLVCTDANPKRLPRLRENLERLHAGEAKVDCHDWTLPPPGEWHGSFDAILLDVPCSNTGVMRRRVDVRWRLQAQDITALTKTQQAILHHAAQCAKPGARMVYSTCSIDAEENAGVVAEFLASHPDWNQEGCREALPFREETDGAFAALLRKSGGSR
jgi:16S rRNA (cytosine967-C5)-methyltransferase